MKKMCCFIAVALILCLTSAAWAEVDVNVEVLRMDGISVVVLTPVSTADGVIAKGVDSGAADFVLPVSAVEIGESAFEGIAAQSVEVTENVAEIGARAFADCASLKQITIPATVVKIDDSAFVGCGALTVYGAKGSEAERIANLYGFTFVDPNAQAETPAVRQIPIAPVLPLAPLG